MDGPNGEKIFWLGFRVWKKIEHWKKGQLDLCYM